MHNDLRFKLWRTRAGQLLLTGVILLALIWLGWNLATNRLPGLAPEPVALATITQSGPPAESHLRVALIPPVNRWFADQPSNQPQVLRVQVENDGSEAGQFQGFIDAPTASCIDLTGAQVPTTSIGPHQAMSFDLIIGIANCLNSDLPILEPFTFRSIWTISAHRGHGHKVPPPANGVQNIQIPGDAEKSTPMTLNLSIHLPGHLPGASSGGPASKPARSWVGFVTTSAISITSRHTDSIHRGLLMLTAIAKDFTWPVLLAFVGFFGQDFLARRGERQQILNALLPTVTDLMQNHYLYLARRMQTVAVEAEKVVALAVPAAPANNIPLRRTFSAILLMRKRILHLTDAKGGIFFRSALAEDIFAIGISAFYSRFQESTADPDTAESVAISLRPDDAPHVAYGRVFGWQGPPNILALYDGFAAWAGDTTGARSAEFDQYLTLLDLCQAVLSFECDRVYYQTDFDGKPGIRNWYFDPPQLDFSGKKLELPKINCLPDLPEGGKKELLRLFTQYLNGIPRECRPGVEYPA